MPTRPACPSTYRLPSWARRTTRSSTTLRSSTACCWRFSVDDRARGAPRHHKELRQRTARMRGKKTMNKSDMTLRAIAKLVLAGSFLGAAVQAGAQEAEARQFDPAYSAGEVHSIAGGAAFYVARGEG